MRQFLVIMLGCVSLAAAGPAAGAGTPPEQVYTICFPPARTTATKAEECRNEDCGLADEPAAQDPEEEQPVYRFLGATDHGVLWASDHVRSIGPDRFRFLLYVQSPVTRKAVALERRADVITDQVIRTTFYSTYGSYETVVASTTYRTVRTLERTENVSGGGGTLQMIDLHCTARKMKIYDNHTLFYRPIEDPSRNGQCLELLWEKPVKPLAWQPASALTMDILVDRYCGGKQ